MDVPDLPVQIRISEPSGQRTCTAQSVNVSIDIEAHNKVLPSRDLDLDKSVDLCLRS